MLPAFLVLVCVYSSLGCLKKEQEAKVSPESNMQTVCFGSYSMKIPQEFGLRSPGSSATFYYGSDSNFSTVDFQVVAERVKRHEFHSSTAERVAEINAEINEVANAPMLVVHEEVDNQTVLLRYFRSDLSTRSHVHEVHRLIDGTHILLHAKSYKGKIESVEARLRHLATTVSSISNDDNIPGFCFGPVVIDSESDYQIATIHYRDKTIGHRDVAVEIEVNTLPRSDEEPRLISRLGGNFLGLGYSPRVLEKGKTLLANMPAEQWLGRDSEERRVEHLFVIESYPERPAARTPGLQINLRTGGVPRSPTPGGLRPYIQSTVQTAGLEGPVSSSLADEEAIALWEAMTSSVKFRQSSNK